MSSEQEGRDALRAALRIEVWPPKLADRDAVRTIAILEATQWPPGGFTEPVPRAQGFRYYTAIYGDELPAGYDVGVRKPGKEATLKADGKKRATTNLNDMLPSVRLNGEDLSWTPNFAELFHQLWQLDRDTLAVLAPLVFRMAYMLDHKSNEDGAVRYQPPLVAVEYLEKRAPTISRTGGESLPFRVVLYLLEVLALQEDVKYWTLPKFGPLGGKNRDNEIGRPNTLKTYINAMACCLGMVTVADLAYELIRRRVAPIDIEVARKLFSLVD